MAPDSAQPVASRLDHVGVDDAGGDRRRDRGAGETRRWVHDRGGITATRAETLVATRRRWNWRCREAVDELEDERS